MHPGFAMKTVPDSGLFGIDVHMFSLIDLVLSRMIASMSRYPGSIPWLKYGQNQDVLPRRVGLKCDCLRSDVCAVRGLGGFRQVTIAASTACGKAGSRARQ
jgi:hypothetical protein